MGDVSSVLAGLNLSPVNTLLLVALIVVLGYVISRFEARVITLEKASGRHGRSISWIKGHFDGEEPKEDDDE